MRPRRTGSRLPLLLALFGICALTSFLKATIAQAATIRTNPTTEHPLWENGAPGAQGNDPRDVPTITPYLAAKENASGAAVLVCPGGGYGGLAAHEGRPIAEWLNSIGVSAFVLKYRLGPRYHHPVMLQDASRAMRTIRARAKDWGIDPRRVGVIGFSAGGHLASTLATHFDAGDPKAADPIDRESSRPDRAILIYPVIALATPYAHRGSLRNLLGDNPDPELIRSLSNETQVTKETPPCFLVHSHEDGPVPAENSLLFVMALRKAGVPSELHLYQKGAHGFGLGGQDPVLSTWPKHCERWLRIQGFLDRTQAP